MTSQQQPASSHGAVDLSSLGAESAAATAGQGGGVVSTAPGKWAVQVDEQLFQEVVQLSTRVPVILAVTNARVPGGDQLRSDLVAAVEAEAGRMVLGLVDPDQQPRVAQALSVQQIPAVFAVLGGRPMPLFTGPVDRTQIEALLKELTQVAVQQGMAGSVPPLNAEADGSEPSRFAEAEAALAADDFDAAAAIYRLALDENPGDDEAATGSRRVELLRRVHGFEAAAVRTRAAEAPDDLQAQLDVADLDVVGGHVEDAFRRLTQFVARQQGETKDAAREHLVDLFAVVGNHDPRVVKARPRLASALF
ncbi:MAG: co-chaperone YbbN [Galactobacter sp.]